MSTPPGASCAKSSLHWGPIRVAIRRPVLLVVIFVIRLVNAQPCSADPSLHWAKSVYLGVSRGEDVVENNDTQLAVQAALYRVPDRVGSAFGVEAGWLGLGEIGFGSADVEGVEQGGTAHYGSAFLGAGMRRIGLWGARVRPYVGAGAAVHAVRVPGYVATPRPPTWLRPGLSLSAGVYGLAPGHFGIEARTHVIPAGRGEGGPLVIYSILASFNDP